MERTREERMAIAKTIQRQLGGHRFVCMTGARDLVALESGLQFSFPKAKQGINRVKVVLKPNDLYVMSFYKVRGCECVLRDMQVADAEDLQRVFTAVTGLDTHI